MSAGNTIYWYNIGGVVVGMLRGSAGAVLSLVEDMLHSKIRQSRNYPYLGLRSNTFYFTLSSTVVLAAMGHNVLHCGLHTGRSISIFGDFCAG